MTYMIGISLLCLLSALVRCEIPSNWISYTPGSCNVIISAPHGGNIKPSSIQDRQHGCVGLFSGQCMWDKDCTPKSSSQCKVRTTSDYKTGEIADLLVQALTEKGCTPYYIKANLYRSKLDANRDVYEGAQYDTQATEAWEEYHSSVGSAKTAVEATYGKGLMIDIHGQAHAEMWTEIGNIIYGSRLNSGNIDLGTSSLQAIHSRLPDLSAADLVQGANSLGGFLSSHGYNVVPSPAHPGPGSGGFYSGGYITKTYSSYTSGGLLDGFQIEIPKDIRFDSSTHSDYANAIAESVMSMRSTYNY